MNAYVNQGTLCDGAHSKENEQTIDKWNNLDGPQGNFAEWKKAILRGHIL